MRLLFCLSVLFSLLCTQCFANDKAQLKAQIRQIIKENEAEIKAEVNNEFDKLDANRNGAISRQEFLNQKIAVDADANQLRQAFDKMDMNHNNEITKREMFSFLKKQMENYLDRI